MPYSEEKTKSGVTVKSKDTGKSFHAPSEAAAKKDEQLHEMFKRLKESGKLPKSRK